MKPDQETLGRYLRRQRETRYVTAEEIALFTGVDRPLVEALEADDFSSFPGRSECLRLVKQYAAYLNLNQTEVLRRFEGQWKLSGDLKRYPKLTYYGDDASQRRRVFEGKRPFAGVSPAKTVVFSVLCALLLAVPFLLNHLPDMRTMVVPPEQAAQESMLPGPTTPPGPTSPSGIVNKAMAPPGEGVSPPAASGAVKAGVPKPRLAPAIDPLYTPPGRVRDKPVPAAAVTAGIRDGGGKPAPPPTGGRVVGNRDTKRYHLPGMKYYDRVKAYHRVIFQSEREALRAGYVKARE